MSATALDQDACFQAISRRDPRFDGRFYTGVTSTGIFCRPSCPARTPKRANVHFYRHPAGAIEAGFRPCKRCRPELAPGNPEWNRRADLAGKAMTLIEQGVVDRHGVAGLAKQLGVSDRHLRRELTAEVGAGPVQLAQTRRLWLARTLLDQTNLSITDVAFAAGFGSVRQFNDAFKRAFTATPKQLRRRTDTSPVGAQSVELTIPSRGTLGWQSLLRFLQMRAIDGLETVDDTTYSRLVDGGKIELTGTPDDDALVVRCQLERLSDLAHWIPAIRVACDLDSDLDLITDYLTDDPVLAHLPTQLTTVPRLPGTFDRFELAVRAVVGQQISLAAARTLLGKLVVLSNSDTENTVYAENTEKAQNDQPAQGFPTAAQVANAPLDQLGMPQQRRDTIRRLATAVADGAVDLSPGSDPETAEAQLLAIKGIGPWTAGYTIMRAFSHPDGWPSGDLVLAKTTGLDAKALDAHAQRWSPWRAYAAMAIWRQSGAPAQSNIRATINQNTKEGAHQ